MNGSLKRRIASKNNRGWTVNHALTHKVVAHSSSLSSSSSYTLSSSSSYTPLDDQDEYSGGSMPLMALEYTQLREVGRRDGERLTQEEGSRRRRTRGVEGAVSHHAFTHKSYVYVHDEYSGGSVPLMALEATKLREMGGCDGKQLTQEE